MPELSRGPTRPPPLSMRSRLRRFAVQGWWKHRWRILAGLWLLTLALGYIGFTLYAALAGQAHSPLDTLRLSLQLFIMQSGSGLGPQPWVLQVAGVLAPVVAFLTALRTLGVLFSDQYHALRLAATRNHVIIAGLGRKGSFLTRKLLAEGTPVVVIERDRDNPNIRACRDEGALALIGDATVPELLRRAGIERAHTLIADVGNDTDNARIATQARILAQEGRAHPLTCTVHLLDPELTRLLAAQAHWGRPDSGFRLEFANVYQTAARELLTGFPLRDATPASPLGGHPHLVIVGLGRLGRSLLLGAARAWRHHGSPGSRLRITVVDRDAERKVADLDQEYPGLADICDCAPWAIDVTGAGFRQAAFLDGPAGSPAVSAIYVCLGDESLALLAGLSLWGHTRDSGIPIVLRTLSAQGLAALVQGHTDDLTTSEIQIFSLLERTCQPRHWLCGTLETLARAIHEEYVAQQKKLGDTLKDNPSLAPWDELPPLLQESNRHQAGHTSAKLAALGYALRPLHDWDAEAFRFSEDEVELMAQAEHERFMAERQQAMRFRRAIPAALRQRMARTLIPWAELAESEREKDRQAVRNLPRLLAQARLQITPTLMRKEQTHETQNP